MKETGIKFRCKLIEGKPVDFELISNLHTWRDKLYSPGLIGVDDGSRLPDGRGIGHGNVSIRFQKNTFIITGANTGRLHHLTTRHYTLVTEYNIAQNSLTCIGPIKASSESLTHAMIYECDDEINAVFHVHHKGLWEKLLDVVPATDPSIEYGTAEMAIEVSRLFRETNLADKKILVMAGHESGIISFGKNTFEAGEILINELKLLK